MIFDLAALSGGGKEHLEKAVERWIGGDLVRSSQIGRPGTDEALRLVKSPPTVLTKDASQPARGPDGQGKLIQTAKVKVTILPGSYFLLWTQTPYFDDGGNRGL